MPVPSLFQQIPCPLCASTNFRVLKSGKYPADITEAALRGSYSASSSHQLLDQVVECVDCSMQYVNPRPLPEIILSGYSDAVDPTFVAQNPQRIETFKKFQSYVLRKLGWNDGRGKRFLDVGCAGGASLVAAQSLGFEAQGVEPSRWMADFGRREYKVDIRDGILTPGMFEAATFDVITMWDVLEHVPEPNALVGLVNQLLKPNGLYILTYPDVGSWLTRLLGDRWPFWLSVHLLYYTPKTIRRQLEQKGFEVLEIRPYYQTLQFDYVLERATPYVPPVAWIRPLVRALGLKNASLTYYIGQTLVIARKK
jgi:SAM-dependent methyltransferase